MGKRYFCGGNQNVLHFGFLHSVRRCFELVEKECILHQKSGNLILLHGSFIIKNKFLIFFDFVKKIFFIFAANF